MRIIASVNPFWLLVQVSALHRALNRSGHPSRKKDFPICQLLHTKNLLQAVLFQSDTKINGLVYDLAVIPYLEDYPVHPDYQINRIKGYSPATAGLPD